jgi:hypothetical protein
MIKFFKKNYLIFQKIGKEILSQSSYMNEYEVNFIVNLYRFIKKTFPSINLNKIGIISPYQAQVKAIK